MARKWVRKRVRRECCGLEAVSACFGVSATKLDSSSEASERCSADAGYLIGVSLQDVVSLGKVSTSSVGQIVQRGSTNSLHCHLESDLHVRQCLAGNSPSLLSSVTTSMMDS